MIRVPAAVADRLQRLADELLVSYEEGRTKNVEICEQGSKGVWVPLHAVITKALDELEDHKSRSKKSSQQKATMVKSKWQGFKCGTCGETVTTYQDGSSHCPVCSTQIANKAS